MLRVRALFFALLFIFAQTHVSAAGSAAHVVIISIDGLPAYLLDHAKARMPNLRRLAGEGVSSAGMHVVNPSVTWPNHTSLVTGVRPERHGVLANGMLVRGATGSVVTIDAKRDQAELVHA